MKYRLVELAHTPGAPYRFSHGWKPLHPATPQDHELAAELRQPDGGFSIDPLTGKKPTRGFMVSSLPDATNTAEIKSKRARDRAEAIAAFRAQHESELADPDTYLGGWHDPDSGNVYLDISRNYLSLNQALEAGKQNNQIAIFDLSNFKSIPTGGSGKELSMANEVKHPQTSSLKKFDQAMKAKHKHLAPKANTKLKGSK